MYAKADNIHNERAKKWPFILEYVDEFLKTTKWQKSVKNNYDN